MLSSSMYSLNNISFTSPFPFSFPFSSLFISTLDFLFSSSFDFLFPLTFVIFIVISSSSFSKRKGKSVLCRICEQLIPSDEMDKHAKMCAQRSAILSRMNAVRAELERSSASLERTAK